MLTLISHSIIILKTNTVIHLGTSMIKKSFFFIFLIFLGVVLFLNPNFKTITAGVAILLFGMIMLEEGFKVS